MVDPSFREVMIELKRALKAQKITYAVLGKRIGISESAVKKIFTGQDCSFSRLNEICKAIGISLSDIVIALERKPSRKFHLNREQEEFFKRDPKHLIFYWKLVFERKDLQDIKREMQLGEKEIRRLLLALDKLNFIKLHVHDRIQLPSIKFVEWDRESSFFQKVKLKWGRKTLEDAGNFNPDTSFTVQYFQLLPESMAEFLEGLRSLEIEFARRTIREMNLNHSETLERLRWVSVSAPGSFV